MQAIHRVSIIAMCAFAFCVLATAFFAPPASASPLEDQVEGLWYYTGLATSDGVERPLHGAFLFKDGIFVQQAVFDGEPFDAQGAMAHAGPYDARADHVHLVAEQTISTTPGMDPLYSSRGRTEHDVTVARDGDALTLVFSMGTGTVQRFDHVGPGEGDIYSLRDGKLALVDKHFLLVQGNEHGSISGYGTFTRDGDDLVLNAIRWTDASPSGAKNLRDTTLRATFDGKSLTLEDGRAIPVSP